MLIESKEMPQFYIIFNLMLLGYELLIRKTSNLRMSYTFCIFIISFYDPNKSREKLKKNNKVKPLWPGQHSPLVLTH